MLTAKQIYEKAAEINQNLLATDERFSKKVFVFPKDGSSFYIVGAFIQEQDNRVMIFSEHHGFFVYDKDELSGYGEFEG